MEAISGKKPLVKYWLHSGFLTINGQKMAKSLGNFITIKEFIQKYSSRILRFLVIRSHYRSPLDYNDGLISQIKKELERIDEFVDKLKNINDSKKLDSKKITSLLLKTEKEFDSAMEDDFNTPKALSSIFNLINGVNILIDTNEINSNNANYILSFLRKIDQFLGVELNIGKISWKINLEAKTKISVKIDIKIMNLVELREKYRKEENWQKADEIRKEIEKLGYQIEDTETGPKIKKL